MQKDAFAVSRELKQYLQNYHRELVLPVAYNDLHHYSHSNAIKDEHGKFTHWETAVYDDDVKQTLYNNLIETYHLLTNRLLKHDNLIVDRIEFCEFGNSMPFRIVIANLDDGNRDQFYVKYADASRIYGLELEHLLSPNPARFLYYDNTLVETHIPGIAGDVFIRDFLPLASTNKQALAKEFVQFNERCFSRLLGDMRSYNFVVEMLGDNLYRIRAIDFDQQSYEGKMNLYLSQFYKENYDLVKLVLNQLDDATIETCQADEHFFIAGRIISHKIRLMELLDCMSKDNLSEDYQVQSLVKELNAHYDTAAFDGCKTMGAIVKKQLRQLLRRHLSNVSV